MVPTVTVLVLLVNVYCVSSTPETEPVLQVSTTKTSAVSSTDVLQPKLLEDLQKSEQEDQGKGKTSTPGTGDKTSKARTEVPVIIPIDTPATDNGTANSSTSDKITPTTSDKGQTNTSTSEIMEINSLTTEGTLINSFKPTKPTLAPISTQNSSTSTKQPTTAIKYCPTISTPTGVIFNSSYVPYGTDVHVNCSAGFSLLEEMVSITCGGDGVWSSNLTGHCHKDCGKDHTIPHAHLNFTGMAITFSSTVPVSCDEGYQIQGDNNIKCLAGGKWSNGTACIVQNCSTDHTIPHAHLNFTGMSVNYSSSVPVSCVKGYQLQGDSNILCLSGGVWSNTTTCQVKNCPTITPPLGVVFNSSNVPYGESVLLKCSPGYSSLEETIPIRCGEDGNWSPNLKDHCYKDCSRDHTIPHAHLNLTGMSITLSSTVPVSCDKGYQRHGDNYIKCLPGGIWSNGATCIIQNCSTDHTLQHASLNFTGMPVSYSSVVPVSCEEGYQLHGDRFIQCLSGGVWSNTTTCQVKNVTLGGGCLASLKQCTDPNTACQNSRCICRLGYYNNSGSCESKPKLPKLEPSILTLDTNSIQVQWLETEGNYTHLVFYIDPPNTDGISKTFHKKDKEKVQMISKLLPGQSYDIRIYVQWKNIESLRCYNLSAYTRPLPAKAINVTHIHETSVTILWSKPDIGSVSGYNLIIYTETEKHIFLNKTFVSTQTQKEVTNLIGGTMYLIYLYTTVPGQIGDPTKSTFYTKPQPLKSSDLSFMAITNNSFQLHWKKPTSTRVDQYKVLINSSPTDGQSEHVVPSNKTSLDFDSLLSSTRYYVQVYTMLQGKLTEMAAVGSLYTRPESPANIHAIFNSTSDVRLTWTNVPSEETVSLYAVRLWQYNKNNGLTEIVKDENITISEGFHYFHNLTAGAQYCVAVLTLLVVTDTNGGEIYNAGIIESYFEKHCNYTRPTSPSAVTIVNRTDTSFNLRLPADTDRKFDSYEVHVSGFVIIASRNEGSETIVPVPNLIPGTHYEIDVFSSIGKDSNKQTSIVFANTTGYTVPSKVVDDSLHGYATSSTTLNLSWSPGFGSFTGFILSPVCHDAYDAPLQINQTVAEHNFTKIIGLSPESYCSIDIQAIAGDQTGISTSFVLTNRTYTSAPDMVAEFHVNNVSDEAAEKRLLLSWDRPLAAKGIIRQYVILIESRVKCAEKIILKCADCNNDASDICVLRDENTQDKNITCGSLTERQGYFSQNQIPMSYNATKLKAFMVYDVSIQAYTRCKGEIKKHDPVLTDQAAPADSPQKFTEKQVSSQDIFFTWDPPSTPNGYITGYQIAYLYKTFTCNSDGPIRNMTKNIYGGVTSYKLNKLQPFWSYSISIRAKTVKGFGPESAKIIVDTLESKPGVIDTKTVIMSTKAYSVFISWSLPCYPNGILTHYGVERANKDNASDVQLYDLETNSMNITDGILPYRNYTFKVRAYTSIGPGNFTSPKYAQTHPAVPHRPKMVSGFAISSNALNASWTPMDSILYTGVTNFTLEAKDTVDSSNVRRCTTSGYYSTFCIVSGLDEYWTYHLKVTARTSAGWGVATFSTVPFRTGEDKPGKVQSVTMTPQNDVTKERSVSVTWHQPSPRDLNGILINYFIIYTMNGINRTISLNNGTYQYEIKEGIMPGKVLIKVYAATKVGNGTVTQDTVTVNPGAVIKPDESQQRLVQPSTEQVDDDKRQFAVSLMLSFLCNSANGQPKKWGVIVSQEELALDQAFVGTTSGYNKRLETYDHWSAIKDKNKIPPYRATNENWQPCNNKGSLRKRRSAVPGNDSVFKFVVGNDGQCSGVPANQYCNGRLQPGRNYKVKSFVCTDGGCTESEYSQPIKTEPDVTVPIVAGVVSGVVVVAAILIIVTLKRRNKLCFAKDVEHQATFERPESLELTKTSKFRPKSVKLSDFPTYVEGLEKDSRILYSEAYRLLKELSPSHPTTVAEIQACRPKTRYTNILPFDQSRVKLLPLDDEEGSDFINANYIPGYTSRREYIACQGPLPATKEDFWRMVWEQRVDIIVMLTKCMEKGKRKCDQYWPEAVQEPIYSGDLIINMQSESVLSDYVIRIIEVKLKDETRVVRQLAYLKWPDMGSPDETHQLLGFVKTVRQFKPHGSKKPMVVHCSAGVGRTGTFIAVDHILQHIRDHDEVDIFSIILDMRNYRCNMVQTEDQFVYIHECVRDFITMDDEEDEEDDDDGDDNHIYANTGYGENVYENTSFQKD